MNSQTTLKQHSIIITDRKRADISGVTELLSYDENAVSMTTTCGSLAIEGKDLHVDKLSLDSGELSVGGELSGVYYYDKPDKQKTGFWSKIVG